MTTGYDSLVDIWMAPSRDDHLGILLGLFVGPGWARAHWAHSFVGPCWAPGPVGAIHLLGPVGAIHLLGSVGAIDLLGPVGAVHLLGSGPIICCQQIRRPLQASSVLEQIFIFHLHPSVIQTPSHTAIQPSSIPAMQPSRHPSIQPYTHPSTLAIQPPIQP